VAILQARVCSALALVFLASGAWGQVKQFSAATVSAEELRHPPTRKALEEFQAARRLSDRGEHDKAAEQLEKAVELSPSYSDAWVNLAAQHLFLQKFDVALRELLRATEIARPTALLLGNEAYAYYGLGKYGEGTRAAREALRLDSSYAPAHYLLGEYLVHNRATFAEGIQHLETAASTMPSAQEELERVRHGLL
jgi:tetratricopeptide (TPR) repeat protein